MLKNMKNKEDFEMPLLRETEEKDKVEEKKI